ncbi:DUF885 domain-containing protein [Spirosoma endophyticum]|uniref:Uncharacterized conserved protein, DUF885 familyt n=1 Tax=Spirosoma endophyticum TaxID=662367 RepID=A0A1I1FMB2_9BACT|nr:DUF885 domain-containing protein [Spirosoma endophyticum]SFC00421.1 Uncharacterized conserved protein, DUF885 familyt [Spirosoma endophyticum]
MNRQLTFLSAVTRTCLLLLSFTCSQLAFGQTPAPASVGFQSLLTAYYEDYLKLNPTRASYLGDYRYNDQLENTFSQPYRDQMKRLYTRYLDGLKAYDEKQLGERDQLNYQIRRYDLTTNLAAMEFTGYLTPMSQMFGFHILFSLLGSGSSAHPFKSAKDYDDFLKRINGFVAQTDTAIANMRTGMAQNYVQPKVVIGKVLPQIKAMLVDDVTKSLFYKPVQNMPATFSAEDKQRLTTAYTTAITQQIMPAYSRLYTFLQNEYLPRCRETVGIEADSNGKAQYAYLVKSSTTTDMTPDEVHALGLSEVKRIRQAIEGIRQQVGFAGDLKAFYAYIDTDPKFFPYKTDEDVLNEFQTIYQTMKPQLSSLFNMVPKTAFEIRPIEKYRAASSPAHYWPGTPDGSRPGVFYFPVLDAAKFSYWGMEDLFLHEAIPGHHYQISLQIENSALPAFQKIGNYGAYTEGWGLYAESLGKALGLYTDPFQALGRYQGEIHRAIRLVVDTGIHQKGWTREQAIQYSLANEPIGEAEAIQEVERYIAWPGQAVSYKIGELKIMAIRQKAEKALGNRFDIRAFHDQVLKDGPMPLAIFEAKMDSWIKSQQAIARKN